MNRGFAFLLNQSTVWTELPPGMITLDYLRRERRLTGTKEGCREGDCGACAVLLGEAAGRGMRYRAVNSCLLPLGAVEGRHVVTIEGLDPERGVQVRDGAEPAGPTLPPLSLVQECFLEEGASQCGFCTPGFIISLTGYLLRSPAPTLSGALEAVSGNICRCTGYASIRRAIARLLEGLEGRLPAAAGGSPEAADNGVIDLARLGRLVELGIVPPYFLDIAGRLQRLAESSAGVGPPPGRKGPAPDGKGPPPGEKGAPPTGRVVVAGGTDLFVQRPEELKDRELRFLSREEELAGMRREDGRLVIGAATSMEQLRALPELASSMAPVAEALQWIASSPIRQQASIGGNLVNASPIGDLSVLLLALDARLGLSSPRGVREVSLDRFYLGYKQLELAAGEVVAWIALSPPAGDAFVAFEKVARRKHLDIASVNSAAFLRAAGGGLPPGGSSRKILQARLSAGGVAPVPLFLARTSEHLLGKEVSAELIREALELAQEEIAPISDVRGSEAYKRLALRQLVIAHFLGAFAEELGGEDWR